MEKEAQVAQILKLLANFRFDMPIVGMELFKFVGEGVDVFVLKSVSPEF